MISGCSYSGALLKSDTGKYENLIIEGYVTVNKISKSPKKYNITIEKVNANNIDTSIRSVRVGLIDYYFNDECNPVIEKEALIMANRGSKDLYIIDVVCK